MQYATRFPSIDLVLLLLQSAPPGWERTNWAFFLQVWTAICSGKEPQGVNRGEVEKGLAANWKRHFTNYSSKGPAPTPAELQKMREDLDKDKKKLPDAMKQDISQKCVKKAEVFYLPESCQGSEADAFGKKMYAQMKRCDPR